MPAWSRAEADARIGLLPSGEGGLDIEMHSGNRSMLFGFGDAHATGSTLADGWFGGEIETSDGQPLRAGATDLKVTIKLWAVDLALLYAVSDAPFSIWYARTVGHGRITRQATLHTYTTPPSN